MGIKILSKAPDSKPHLDTRADINGHEDGSYNWLRTLRVNERRPDIVEHQGAALFHGRPIIDRNSRISGGVYLGGSKREALVVDWLPARERYGEPTPLTLLFKEALSLASDHGSFDKRSALKAVYQLVRSHFSNKEESAVKELLAKCGVRPDDKIPIDLFIVAKTGVCRHQALTIGAILERMVDEGYLKGQVNIHRNESALGAHAWVRYTSSNGTPIILDAMQGYFGKLSDCTNNNWNYRMPGES